MCRLLGMVAPEPMSFTDAAGTAQIARFRDLACLHTDGWGAVWLDEARSLQRYRSTSRADADPAYDGITTAARTKAGIAHLRWATTGMANEMANTHPFLTDGVAFAHNGFAGETAELDEFIAPEIRSTLAGETDSERYFGVIRTRLAQGLALPEAVTRAVADLRGRYPEHSLNAMLLSAGHLVVVHASDRALPDIDEMLEAGFTLDTLPAEHAQAYYAMRMRRDADGTLVFASSGLDPDGWEPLPPESVTSVDLRTGAMTTRTLLPDLVS
jgi:glutamine amidotransferase